MSSYLARRGGIWWARLVVPKPLRKIVGRREFSQSTKTSEVQLAKLVSSVLLAGWRSQLLALQDYPLNSDILKLIGPATGLAVGSHVSLADAVNETGITIGQFLRYAGDGKLQLFCRLHDVAGYVVPIEDLELSNAALGARGGYDIPTPRQMPKSAAEVVLGGLLAIPVQDSALIAGAVLAEELEAVDVVAFQAPDRADKYFVPDKSINVKVGRFEIQASEAATIHRLLSGKVTAEQADRAHDLQKAVFHRVAVASGKNANKLFSVALEEYSKDASGLPKDLSSATEQKQRKKGCMLFAEFMGDLPLIKIDSDTLRAFRDGPLRKVLANQNNLPKELKRSTMKESIEAIRVAGCDWPLMSANMQYERMQWLCRFFAWLKEKAWITENPAAGIQGETGLTKSERKDLGRVKDDDEGRGPFTPDDLKLIFGQSWFKTGSGEHFKKPRKWYPFEYWLPLLGLYAGCRISEASQLHLSDVKVAGVDVWYLDINEVTKDKSVKNDQSKRVVPLHPKLIELGFLDYCDRLRQEGYRRVFPELSFTKTDARYAKESIRKMSAMLSALGMPRDSMKVFHCLRHNMNNGLARVQMPAQPFVDEFLKKFIRCKVLGHTPGDDVNAKHYTSVRPEEAFTLVACLAYDLPIIAKFDIVFAVEQIRAALDNKDGERKGREDMGPLNDY